MKIKIFWMFSSIIYNTIQYNLELRGQGNKNWLKSAGSTEHLTMPCRAALVCAEHYTLITISHNNFNNNFLIAYSCTAEENCWRTRVRVLKQRILAQYWSWHKLLLFKCFFISCCNCFLFFTTFGGKWEYFWVVGRLEDWMFSGGAGTLNTDSTLMLRWLWFRLVFASSKKSRLEFWKLWRNAAATKLAKKYVAENVSLFPSSFLVLLFCLILFIFCVFCFLALIVFVIVLSFVSTPDMLQFCVGPLRKCLAATPQAQKTISRYVYVHIHVSTHLKC